jgi:hypothetical protein
MSVSVLEPPKMWSTKLGHWSHWARNCEGTHPLWQLSPIIMPPSAAYWGWLVEGTFRWSAPPLIQDGRYGRQTPGSTGPIFWWLIGGDWRKVPFDDCSSNMAAASAILDECSSNMAATAAIFYLVSIDYLTNASRLVPHWGSSIFTMFHFSLSLIVHTPTDNIPIRGICHALRCPC